MLLDDEMCVRVRVCVCVCVCVCVHVCDLPLSVLDKMVGKKLFRVTAFPHIKKMLIKVTSLEKKK